MRLVAAFQPASRTGIAQRFLNVGRVKPANNTDKLRGFHPPYMAVLQRFSNIRSGAMRCAIDALIHALGGSISACKPHRYYAKALKCRAGETRK
jgi:hypothetical protein